MLTGPSEGLEARISVPELATERAAIAAFSVMDAVVFGLTNNSFIRPLSLHQNHGFLDVFLGKTKLPSQSES